MSLPDSALMPMPLSDNGTTNDMRIEYESTIEVAIDAATYNRYRAIDGPFDERACVVDVVLQLENGARLHERRFERKVTTEMKRVLAAYRGTYFPVQRTRSTEGRLVTFDHARSLHHLQERS